MKLRLSVLGESTKNFQSEIGFQKANHKSKKISEYPTLFVIKSQVTFKFNIKIRNTDNNFLILKGQRTRRVLLFVFLNRISVLTVLVITKYSFLF